MVDQSKTMVKFIKTKVNTMVKPNETMGNAAKNRGKAQQNNCKPE